MTIRAIVIAATFLATTLSSGTSAQVINGCIKNNGTLKIVADPTDCSSRETPISWNQEGLQGEPGEPGPPGVPGDPEGALQQQVDALQGQTASLPIVVDNAGEILGYVLDARLHRLARCTRNYGNCVQDNSWNQTGPQGEPGEPGEPGVEGPTGPSLRMFDAAGNVLGIPWHLQDSSHSSRVFVEDIDLSMTRDTLEGNSLASATLFFEMRDCQGQAYVEAELWINHLTGPYPDPLPTFFAVEKTGIVPNVVVKSTVIPREPAVGCRNRDHQLNAGPAIAAFPFTGALPFSFPPPTPFYVGLPPE